MLTSTWTSRPPPEQAASAKATTINQRDTMSSPRLRWAKATALLGLLQLLPALLAAQSPAITRLFPARPDGYLTDRASLVDPTTASRINDLAARLRQATGAELAVVTLPTIEDQAPGDVALTIGRVWGVGGK